MKSAILFWAVNFVPVSVALAIFEIWLETTHKHGPWGKTAFDNPFWERQLGWPLPFLNYITVYHAIVFLLVVPLTLTLGMAFWSKILGYQIFPVGCSRSVGALSFTTLLVAMWFGNGGLEDFLYFLIQSITGWRTPDALQRVIFRKDMAWFKDWLPTVLGLSIPGHWLFCPSVAIALLYMRQRWIVS